MKGKRFKEERIIRILHKAEGGLTVAEVCRKHNCSEQSFYRYVASKKPFDETYREVVRLSGRYSYWGDRKILSLPFNLS